MTRWSVAVYRLLVRLIPREFRASYGTELEEAFVESARLFEGRWGRAGALYALLRAAWDLALLALRLGRRPRRIVPRLRSPRRLDALEAVSRDFRVAARRLLRTPSFTLAAITTLAIGVGTTVVMLTVFDSVVLRPLPYAESDRLVALFLHEESHGARRAPTSPVNFLAWRSESSTLELMTAAHPWAPSLTGRDRPDELHGLKVSPSLFRLLGIAPSLGRALDEGDGSPEGERVVVIGHSLWARRFESDPGIVGTSLLLDGEPYHVVGVMPEGFSFPPFWSTSAEMWTPLVLTSDEAARHGRFLRAFARLKEGVSLEEARTELETLGARLEERFPEENRATSATVEPLLEPVIGEARPLLALLLAAVLLLTLVACANVANLNLVRATSRAKEAALETALGAGRSRLLCQQIAESLLLAAAAGIVGGLIAAWGVPALVGLAPEGLPRHAEITVDHRLFGFALLVSVGVAVFLGLATTPRTRGANVAMALRDAGARATSARGRRVRDGLVVVQMATSVVLLAAAGLVVRSFLELRRVDPGFHQDGLLTSSILLKGSSHTSTERQVLLFRRIPEILGEVHGVEDVALIDHLPIGGDLWGIPFALGNSDGSDRPRATQRTVTPAYFRTMGIPLLAGRAFSEIDDERAAKVVIVNRTLAERYGTVSGIVGRPIWLGRERDDERIVIGVVGDSRQWDLTLDVPPEIYFPYYQNPHPSYLTTTLVVASSLPPEELAPRLERAVWSVAGEIPITNVRTMERILSEHVAPRRFTSMLFALFAALALGLAAIGLYGVASYTVSEQRVEIGIRAALGATGSDIASLVLARGTRLAALGLAVGIVAGLAGSPLVSALLYGVSPTDPATYAFVSAFLMSVALVAVYLPARRAARVDPVRALRND